MILSVDVGTSKISALVVDVADGTVVASASAANDADVSGLPAGRHEQNPQRICAIVQSLMQQVMRDDVEAIAISGQMHGVLLVDGKGEPATNLITWRDQRGAGRALSRQAALRTGCAMHPGYGGATLATLDTQGKTALTIADYVALQLTGVAATEVTHAASWGLLNLERGDWDDGAIEELGIDRAALPAVKPSCGLLGHTEGGIVVASPIGDNQASFIGAAGLADDVAVVNLGTGGQVSVRTDDLTYHPPLETRPMPGGGAILVGASLCGGWAYAYLKQFYQQVAADVGGVSISDAQAYEKINDLAATSDGGGLIADTRYLGTRGDPSVRGSIANIDANNLTPANLARAVLEGMVRELADLARGAGVQPARVIASGNAVRRNPLVRQLIAEQFGAACEVGEAREEAALGAAVAAAAGLGITAPRGRGG